MSRHKAYLSALLIGLALLAGCSTMDRGSSPALERNAQWVVLPFANHTETPLAGSRAEAITESILISRGITRVKHHSGALQKEALFESNDSARQVEALEWAREQGATYAIAGAVDEWRYKVGVDGEPAAGIAIRIIDVKTGDVVWSGAGGKSGWSREALSAVAQQLIRDLLKTGLANIN